ncbi:MAG TPA: RHS repeat-associated core domain-containing protein [Candidatus Acidoferrum sp.]|nr:RHS repeat-associated core domain-containing protein [Candidatus Acidoferrum sp.]
MPAASNFDASADRSNSALPSAPTNEYSYAGGLRVAIVQSGSTYYSHRDHLSPRVRTDSSGNVADQRGTFPFGETWYTPNSSAPWVFGTYYRDAEAEGNDYAQARTYVGGLGRFSSPDPIAGSTSDPQSLNRYSYVRNMPIQFADPLGTCPPVVQNRDPNQDQSKDSQSGGGPFINIFADPSAPYAPAQVGPQGDCNNNPWYDSSGGGGAAGLDGGFNGDDSGFGIGSPAGVSPGDPFSVIDAALTPTGGHSVDPCPPGGDCGRNDMPFWVNDYGNMDLLWLLGAPGGWTIDPKDLILKVTRDCFNQGAGQREVSYQLATQSGNPLVGRYNITEQQSDTSLTPPDPWGQSHNYPELGETNVFNDILRPGLFSSKTVKSTQYFLVSPGGLGIAQWVPISRPGQPLSKFNTIVMQGPLSSNPNTVKINGRAALPCGSI